MTTNKPALSATWITSPDKGIFLERRSDLITMQEISELTEHLNKRVTSGDPPFKRDRTISEMPGMKAGLFGLGVSD